MEINIKLQSGDRKGKFVLYEGDKQAGEIIFNWIQDGNILIKHTLVDEAFGGKGYAKKLVLNAVDYARENNIKIVPECSYAKSVFDKDNSLSDVRA